MHQKELREQQEKEKYLRDREHNRKYHEKLRK